MVLRLTLSRTLTTPFLTCVSVPAQLSCTSQRVPRTVAALYWPRVRNEPEPSPQSLRVFGFFLAAACAVFFFGHFASASLRVRSVVVLVCVILKTPSKNLAFCSGAPGFCWDVISIVPCLVSI